MSTRNPYARPLLTDKEMRAFLEQALEIPNPIMVEELAQCEGSLEILNDNQFTIDSDAFRNVAYSTDAKRWELRKRIVHELFHKKRATNDEHIKLGKGGALALPKKELKKNSKAFVIIGLPASGKSGVANTIANHYGAVILDSDYAKRKLPEFEKKDVGATITHDESDAIVFGGFKKQPSDFESLYSKCVKEKINIVIVKIGKTQENILAYAEGLKKLHYDVHLVLVSLDRKLATCRAYNRYKKTLRYVPLALIFDGYGNDPILTYYRLKTFHPKEFKGFLKLSTNVPVHNDPKVIDSMGAKLTCF